MAVSTENHLKTSLAKVSSILFTVCRLKANHLHRYRGNGGDKLIFGNEDKTPTAIKAAPMRNSPKMLENSIALLGDRTFKEKEVEGY